MVCSYYGGVCYEFRPGHAISGFLAVYSVCTHILDTDKVCLRSEDAFVITCVANLMEVKVLYVQQDLRYEISSYWCFKV
jgi:hypothetical protein